MSKRKKRPKLRNCYERPPPVLMKCKAESEDICRALYCPKARGNKAYCPWEANGRIVNTLMAGD
jgi:hypothetical protein